MQKGNESSFSSLDHINDGPFILPFSPQGPPWMSYFHLVCSGSPPTKFPWIFSQPQCVSKLLFSFTAPPSPVLPSLLPPPYLSLQKCLSTSQVLPGANICSVKLFLFSPISCQFIFFKNKSYRHAEKPEVTKKNPTLRKMHKDKTKPMTV